jgi:hypothetical protein
MNIEDDDEDLNIEDMADEIGASLFDDDNNGVVEETQPVEVPAKEPAASEPALVEVDSSATSAEVQALGAPDTWTKDAIAEWATVPPRVQQEILKREQDMIQGIESYKGRASLGDAFNSIVEPYVPLLQQNGLGVPEVSQIFSGMLANHVKLVQGTADQKMQTALNVLRGYGIDPVELALAAGGQQQNPEITALRQELGQVRETLAQREQREQQQAFSSALAQIDAFAAANPYYREVEADIDHLLSTGAEETLEKAYERAVWNNPRTRQKEWERLNAANPAPAPAKPAAQARALASNIASTPHPGNGAVPVGSMDDTIAETMAIINARG